MLEYFSQNRSVEKINYTFEDFIFRWKKLQRVIAKENLDGLLLITGIDALDNVNSAYLFNWLFLGLSGKHVVINKFLQDIYNEMVVFMSSKGSFIFLPPEARKMLEPLIYGIPNCRIYCPTEQQYANKEKLDILKITFFYEMLQSLKTIGVFLGEEEDPKSIEKWPIIQTYALQPVGRTFFTLKYKVSNVHAKVYNLFKNLDSHSLKSLVGQTSYTLEGHMSSSFGILQLSQQNNRIKISEGQIQQSLQEKVDIETLQSGSKNVKDLVRVLFGQRTGNKQNISSSQCTIQSTNALHSTIQLYDPYTKMKIWRTYFLANNAQTRQQIKIKVEEDQQTGITKTRYQLTIEKNNNFDNGTILISLYLGLAQGVLDTISTVSKDYRNLTKQFFLKGVYARIKPIAQSLYGEDAFKQTDIDIELQSFDAFGEPKAIDFKDSMSFKLTSTFYLIKARLNSIVSKDKNEKLGSVIFSQAFLLQQGCYLLLTKNVKYFDFNECKQQEKSLLEKLNPNYQNNFLGKSLHQGSIKGRLFIPSEKLSHYHIRIPVLQIKIFFHQKGFRIHNQKLGWRLLEYCKLSDFTMINKLGEWTLMKVQQPFLFHTLQNDILAIQFKGKAFEHLMNKVNSKQNPISISFIDVIPPFLADNWYFTEQIMKKEIKQGALMHQHQILQNEFLWSFIQAKQMCILNQLKDLKFNAFKTVYQEILQQKFETVKSEQGKQAIIVINGTYGSNKFKVAQSLKNFGPKHLQLSIFHVSSDNLYSRIQMSTFIDLLKQHITDNDIKPSENSIVLVVLPSWLNSQQFLQIAQNEFFIKSVVSTLGISNFFSSKNYDLVQNVVTFAWPGFCQNIIVDTYGEYDDETSPVMRVVWSINKVSKILRSTNNVLSTGQCKDILQQSSYCSDHQKFYRNKYGSLYNFQQLSQLSINFIPFKLPIYNLPEIKKLSANNGYLIDIAAIRQQLLPKKQQAQHSKDELMMGLYDIEQSLTITRRKRNCVRMRYLQGKLRVKDQQGITQVFWANHMYKQTTKPNQQAVLGIFVITKNYDEMEIKKFFENISFKKVLMEGIKPLKSIQQFTEEDIKKIGIAGRDKYMDGGQFFDGYTFRDVEGYPLTNHPQIDKLIQEHLDVLNADIKANNEAIKKQWQQYQKKFNDS